MSITHVMKSKCKLFQNGTTVCPMCRIGSLPRPSNAGKFTSISVIVRWLYLVILTSYEGNGGVEKLFQKITSFCFIKIYRENYTLSPQCLKGFSILPPILKNLQYTYPML
jgi:hypothetical protein